MAEGGGARPGGTEMMEGVSESEPYPGVCTSAAPGPEEKNSTGGGGGGLGSNLQIYKEKVVDASC